MLNVNSNPVLGTFRHSPATPTGSLSLGLKSILLENPKAPFFSQVQLAREKNQKRKINLTLLKTLTFEKFSFSQTNSLGAPQCVICLEGFADGDEFRSLACNHCFHRTCIDNWLMIRWNCPLCLSTVETQEQDKTRQSHNSYGQNNDNSSQEYDIVSEACDTDVGLTQPSNSVSLISLLLDENMVFTNQQQMVNDSQQNLISYFDDINIDLSSFSPPPFSETSDDDVRSNLSFHPLDQQHLVPKLLHSNDTPLRIMGNQNQTPPVPTPPQAKRSPATIQHQPKSNQRLFDECSISSAVSEASTDSWTVVSNPDESTFINIPPSQQQGRREEIDDGQFV